MWITSSFNPIFAREGGDSPPPYMSFRHKSNKNDSIVMIFGNNYQLDVRKLSKKISSIRGAGGRRREDELGEVQREIPKILYIDFKN